MDNNLSIWRGPRAPFAHEGWAWLFLLSLLFFLSFPLLQLTVFPAKPENRFYNLSMSRDAAREIFRETKPIDVLFLGNSYLYRSFDTPYVQQTLSQRFGKELNVLTLGMDGCGMDVYYAATKDLLARRKVKLFILGLSAEFLPENNAHFNTPRWWRAGENWEEYKELDFPHQAQLYAGFVLGSLRSILLNAYFPDRLIAPVDPLRGWMRVYRHGVERPYIPAPGSLPDLGPTANFPDWRNPADENKFAYRFKALPPYHAHFARKLAALLKNADTHPIMIHLPTSTNQAEYRVQEAVDWKKLGFDMPMIARTGRDIFRHVDRDTRVQFFVSEHLDYAGANFFSRVMAPAIGDYYENLVAKR